MPGCQGCLGCPGCLGCLGCLGCQGCLGCPGCPGCLGCLGCLGGAWGARGATGAKGAKGAKSLYQNLNARGDRFLAGRAINRTRALKKPLAVARGLTLALSRGACVVIGADGSSAILGGTQRRDSRNRVATRSVATCSTRFTSPNCVSGKLLKSMSRCSNWRPRVASSTANRTSCSATLR